MKTKEEIEQLAEEFLTFHQDGSKVYHIKIREAIEFAYTQCQEDMAKEIAELKMLCKEYSKDVKALNNIITPQEPKQETLEEFIKKSYLSRLEDCLKVDFEDGVKLGAKWQQDNADKKLDEDDIKEMALDYIINTGGLPKTIEEWQNALWKFYQSLNKQDNEK